jgi:hypothetical protein
VASIGFIHSQTEAEEEVAALRAKACGPPKKKASPKKAPAKPVVDSSVNEVVVNDDGDAVPISEVDQYVSALSMTFAIEFQRHQLFICSHGAPPLFRS